jgi:hypothetical protein
MGENNIFIIIITTDTPAWGRWRARAAEWRET